MARVKSYWKHEQAKEFAINDMRIKVYEQAGVIQFFNWIDSSNYTGYSKGVTLHLDKLNDKQMDAIIGIFQGAFIQEIHQRDAAANAAAERTKELENLHEELKDTTFTV